MYLSLGVKLSIFIILSGLLSCSGYRFQNKKNPLLDEGINSVAIPMFINKSSIANVASVYTREISKTLSNHTNLRVYMGDHSSADAILVGIISSRATYNQIFAKERTQLIEKGDGELSNSIGDRPSFSIPTAKKFELFLRVVLIRRPSDFDKELVHSDLLPYLQRTEKIIFNQEIRVEGHSDLSARGTENLDSVGITNSPRSLYNFEQTVADMAKRSAEDFRDLILNVF